MAKTVVCHGSVLFVQPWLVSLWPDDEKLPLEAWPTFCGAGKLGDLLIPDHVCGVNVAPACFIHDLDFATLPRLWSAFILANNRFLTNMISLVSAHAGRINPDTIVKECHLYFVGVTNFGWPHFRPSGQPWHIDNAVRQSLNRLSMAIIRHDKCVA